MQHSAYKPAARLLATPLTATLVLGLAALLTGCSGNKDAASQANPANGYVETKQAKPLPGKVKNSKPGPGEAAN